MHVHGSSDHTTDSARRVRWALSLTVVFMFVEVAGGVLSGSLALLADAGHMLTDSAALALALFAFKMTARPADTKRSFGYHRAQILAAFVNGITLIAIVGWILWEAAGRLMQPREIIADTMLGVAIAGLVVNLFVLWILRGGDQHNLNISAAALHVLGDLLGSAGAVVAAGVIITTGWTPIDPLLSVLVALLVFRSAWRLIHQSAHILLEGKPDWLDVRDLQAALIEAVPGLTDVHHVHVWSLDGHRMLLTMHAVVEHSDAQPEVLRRIKQTLQHRYGIEHSTIEVDLGVCADAHEHEEKHAAR